MYDIPRSLAPPVHGTVVHHAELFQEHPELLDWYQTNIGHPLEDILRMEMTDHDEKAHIWVYFHSMPDAVGYRAFMKNPDGRFTPMSN